MRRQKYFQLTMLAYLAEDMSLYGTYSANSIMEIEDTINHLPNTLSKHDRNTKW